MPAGILPLYLEAAELSPLRSEGGHLEGEVQVHSVQIVAVEHEALQLVVALRPHDHAHVREYVLAPLRYFPVVLQPILLLELPAKV